MSTSKTIERVETETQSAARRHGLTMSDLAARMGVTKGYLSQVANGHRKWTPKMRAKVMAVLGEVPGQSMVHMRQEAVDGESTYIRERARELGLTIRDVAAGAGFSQSYVSQLARGHRIMTVNARTRLEAALEGSAEIAPSQRANTNIQALWDRLDAHRINQSEVARRAGISSAHMSQIVSGQRRTSPTVLREAARGAVPAVQGRAARHARRGEGAGLAEG